MKEKGCKSFKGIYWLKICTDNLLDNHDETND